MQFAGTELPPVLGEDALRTFLPVLASTALFAVLQRAARAGLRRVGLGKTDKEVHALADRVTGWVHAVGSAFAASYFLTFPKVMITDPGPLCTPMTNGFQHLAQFSAGYFLLDILMSCGGGWGFAYILHAVFSFCAYIVPVVSTYGHPYSCGFLFFEWSTIPFHVAYLIKAWVEKTQPGVDSNRHPAVLVFQGLFSVTFLVARIGFGYWFSGKFVYEAFYGPFPTCVYPWVHFIIVPMNIIFNGLNTFWAYKIILRAIRVNQKAAKVEHLE